MKLIRAGDMETSYLAFRYLRLIVERRGEHLSSGSSSLEKCDTCKSSLQSKSKKFRWFKTSRDFLEYVLETTGEGSPKNLGGRGILERKASDSAGNIHFVGKGGYSEVYKDHIQIEGKRIAVKILRISNASEECVIKVSIALATQ